MKHGTSAARRPPHIDAPHTGARLETLSQHFGLTEAQDAPHTGARLETINTGRDFIGIEDAPHTGARLETATLCCGKTNKHQMPPTRGHDLKHQRTSYRNRKAPDAPHTGARLETDGIVSIRANRADAPHTGARLETFVASSAIALQLMPPTRGHDLKPACSLSADPRPSRMPPTRGHDLKPVCTAHVNTTVAMPPTRGHDLKPPDLANPLRYA